MPYYNKVESHWLVYWKDVKNGVPPLGLVATFPTRLEAIEYIYRSDVFAPKDWEKLAVTMVFQVLCEKGHLSCFDAYDDIWQETTCTHQVHGELCHAPYVWSHEVDQTNDEGTPAELEILEPAITQTCNFGHSHVIVPETYKIPEEGSVKP